MTAVVTAAIAPSETLAARRSDLLSTLLYVANWHFIATDQSYFASYAGVSPLRHVWSLAIEEQFYIAWPLIVAAACWGATSRERLTNMLWLTGAGAAVSALTMASLYDVANPSRSYFGTDARAHQLLAGVALAMFAQARPQAFGGARARRLAARAWPAVALALGVAFVTFEDQAPSYYHGGSVLFALAVAAAIWIVEVAPGGALGRGLSLAPLRWIGQISYGLYLWHWPLIVWIGDADPAADPWTTHVAEIALTFAAAVVSFYLLERPIREGRAPWLGRSRRRLALATVIAVELVAALAVLTTIVDEGNTAVARGLADRSDAECPPGSPAVLSLSWCVRVAPASAAEPVVAVTGDSTSRALDPGMQALAEARGWGYVQAGQGGCSALALALPNSTEPRDRAASRRCAAAVPRLQSAIAARRRPDVWIVSDRIPIGAPILHADGRLVGPGRERDRRLRAALRGALARLTAGGAQVVVVTTPPPGEPADCAAANPPASCAAPGPSALDGPTRALRRLVRSVVAGMRGRAALVSIDDVLCPDGRRCPAVIDGVLARYDQIHYTSAFSRRIVPRIVARAEREGIRFARRPAPRP